MEHTPTPWYCDGDGVYSNVDCEGAPLAYVLSMGYDNDFRSIDASRIVACVNACAGLDTEQLEQFGLGTAFGTVLFDVTAERDKLRTVCAEAYQFAGAYDAPVEVLDNLSAAANGWPLPHESFLPVMDSESVAQRDELQSQLTAECASLFAENQRKQQLEQQVEELVAVLESVLPWVVTQEVACHGLKCREPVCMSCSIDSEEAAEKATHAYEEARAVIQKVRGGEC